MAQTSRGVEKLKLIFTSSSPSLPSADFSPLSSETCWDLNPQTCYQHIIQFRFSSDAIETVALKRAMAALQIFRPVVLLLWFHFLKVRIRLWDVKQQTVKCQPSLYKIPVRGANEDFLGFYCGFLAWVVHRRREVENCIVLKIVYPWPVWNIMFLKRRFNKAGYKLIWKKKWKMIIKNIVWPSNFTSIKLP